MEGQNASGPGIVTQAAAFTVSKAGKLLKSIANDDTLPSVMREAVKDIRGTSHEVFFGQNEHVGEPGAPLNPTQGEVAADRKPTVHGKGHASPSAIAGERGSVHGQDKAPSPVQGEVHAKASHRSPSDIAADKGGVQGPEQGQGQHRGREMGRGM